jgi:dolichol-phosphate mannosyltransferase
MAPQPLPIAWVIVPTYNEAANLRPLVTAVLAQPGVTGVIVVDDASPDGTGRLAEAMASETAGRVHVVARPAKLGLGTAYLAGIATAQGLNAERVLTMDADFSHPPDAIPRLLSASRRFELVIGSRYVPGGGTRNWGWHRRLLSRSANAFARASLGLAANDCTAGFRCYDAALLARLDLGRIRSDGYAFLVETLLACQQAGATLAEVPILFTDREHGASKISQREILRALETVSRLALQRGRSAALDRRPTGRPRLGR